jgi:hypothetical protein
LRAAWDPSLPAGCDFLSFAIQRWLSPCNSYDARMLSAIAVAMISSPA